MKRIWNSFCEDISNNKDVREMTFEKADFAFYKDNDKNANEIILELKKTDHKQRKVDIEQIEAYMKLTDCRFGLYFGEKLEVFYLQGKKCS